MHAFCPFTLRRRALWRAALRLCCVPVASVAAAFRLQERRRLRFACGIGFGFGVKTAANEKHGGTAFFRFASLRLCCACGIGIGFGCGFGCACGGIGFGCASLFAAVPVLRSISERRRRLCAAFRCALFGGFPVLETGTERRRHRWRRSVFQKSRIKQESRNVSAFLWRWLLCCGGFFLRCALCCGGGFVLRCGGGGVLRCVLRCGGCVLRCGGYGGGGFGFVLCLC